MSPRMQRIRAEIASDLQIFASRFEVLTSLPHLSDTGRPELAPGPGQDYSAIE